MKRISKFGAVFAALLVASVVFVSMSGDDLFLRKIFSESEMRGEENEQGHADEAFEWWYAQRALPNATIPHDALMKAHDYMRALSAQTSGLQKTTADSSVWESIGPNNVGGRVLTLAIDPDSTNVVWAGSAGGGLWRSGTGGVGTAAWVHINTGFPLLAASTIAINPQNSNEMYVGSGEISGYNLGQVGTPGARTTYSLGVLKSTNRGVTWDTTGLNWSFSQTRSVQKVIINPKNPSTLYAATSEGTYRSNDKGKTWTLSNTVLMAMDAVINPVDTSEVYVACGQRNTAPNPGLYKTTNAGATWSLLAGGLPTTNFGRTSLAISPTNPSIVYAGISNASSFAILGLYRTNDKGTTWTLASSTNYVSGQGWYDNIIAVSPTDTNTVLCAGLDIYRSTTGGAALTKISDWSKYLGGVIPAGGKEGSTTNYAHADHHAMVFDPKNSQRILFGCDGGIFESTNGGTTFDGRNGGFVTTQFYNGFVNAEADSFVALGGLQDNGTVKYQGAASGASWNKVFGGDGGWCGIDAANKSILFEEYVYMAISRSTDGGTNWAQNIISSVSDSSNFIAPFVVAPSNGLVLYAGAKKIFKTTDRGATWAATNGGAVINGSNISCLAVSYGSSDTIIAATGQRPSTVTANPLFEVFASANGGVTWTKSLSLLPTLYPTDISFDPTNSKVAYLTYSGYGGPHVFKSTDAGLTWSNISANLPDLPTQSICVDPVAPQWIFVGTDLGVFRSSNGGTTWAEWNEGMPQAMVLDVAVSKADRRLRAATFGNGVFQRKLPAAKPVVFARSETGTPAAFSLGQNYPNPFNPATTIRFTISDLRFVTLKVFDALGREVATLVNGELGAGSHSVEWDAAGFASGIYFYRIEASSHATRVLAETKKMLLLK